MTIRTKLFLTHATAVLLIGSTVGVYFYISAVDSLKAGLQSRLKSSAALLSQVLEGTKLDAIREESDQDLPVYREYLELLRSFRRANSDIAYMYVMRRVGDRIFFVIDSDETDAQALPGREYTTRVSAMLEGFLNPSVDDEIVTDEWGSTLSGYAPLKDAEQPYLIGIDMNADEVQSKYQRLRISGVVSLLTGIALALLLSRFLAHQLTTPVTLLISRCKAIADGNLEEQIHYRNGDELDDLTNAFNNMSAKLSETRNQRREAQKALERANDEIESRIAERTRDLKELNDRLRTEVDIRNQTMEALRASEERYRDLANLLPQPVFEADGSGNLTFMNRAAFDTFGYLQTDFDKGLKLYQILAAEEGRTISLELCLQLEGERVGCAEHAARRKDGTTFPVCTYFSPIVSGKETEGLRGIVIDISERKRVEEDLLKTQKLESIGILAAGIAHDFNNLLTTIMGSISLARNLLEPEQKLDKLLGSAEKASLQARHLTKQLVSLSTGNPPVRSPFSIRGSIRDAVDLALSGSNLKYDLWMDEDLRPVSCDPGQIQQMIVNLVINAKEAMPQGGMIQIEATNTDLESFKVGSLKAGEYVKITVRDFGIGITKEDLPRIMDPYFSTKRRGRQKGMGLGLTIAYSVARRHDGHINVHSDVQVGTQVDVYLPAAEAKPVETLKFAKDPASPHRVKVLLMDDDEMVRDLAEQMLTHLGFQFNLARDGAEAISLFTRAREEDEPYDCIILDLTVRAGMGGKEALTAMLGIDSDVRAVAISGYSDDPVMSHFADFGFRDAIPKPFQLEELRDVLHRIMPEKSA